MANGRDQGPVTRNRRKQQKQNKRNATLFQPSKVIGPNDIAVTLSEGKIRFEETDLKPVVKLEKNGGDTFIKQDTQATAVYNAMALGESSEVVVKLEEVIIPESDETMEIGNSGQAENLRVKAKLKEKDSEIKKLKRELSEVKGRLKALEMRFESQFIKVVKSAKRMKSQPVSVTGQSLGMAVREKGMEDRKKNHDTVSFCGTKSMESSFTSKVGKEKNKLRLMRALGLNHKTDKKPQPRLTVKPQRLQRRPHILFAIDPETRLPIPLQLLPEFEKPQVSPENVEVICLD